MAKIGRPSPGLDEYLYWQGRLADRKARGVKIRSFCAKEGISRSTYYRWVERLKEGIPEEVKEEAAKLALPAPKEPKFLPVSVTALPIEIALPNGSMVRLPASVEPSVVVTVLETVCTLRRRRRCS